MSTAKSTEDLLGRVSRMKELAAKLGQMALEIQVETGTSVTGHAFGRDFAAALQNGGMHRKVAGEMAGALTHSFLRLHEDAVNIFEQSKDVLKELGSTEHIIMAAKHRTGPKPHAETFATNFQI